MFVRRDGDGDDLRARRDDGGASLVEILVLAGAHEKSGTIGATCDQQRIDDR
jgi:hypothetical protein